jgi:hypothetical protein
MQTAVRRYAEEARRTAGVSIHIRVGVNSGDVVVRSIGSDLRMDYSAVGQTTHLAARMEQIAEPGSIVATADTIRSAEGYVQVASLGHVTVGVRDADEVYAVIGSGMPHTRLQAAAARGLTRFVGREAEVAQLDRVLASVARGRGQVVGVVGEPGVGKSRLCYEFTNSLTRDGWLVLHATATSYGKTTAYRPVIPTCCAAISVSAALMTARCRGRRRRPAHLARPRISCRGSRAGGAAAAGAAGVE